MCVLGLAAIQEPAWPWNTVLFRFLKSRLAGIPPPKVVPSLPEEGHRATFSHASPFWPTSSVWLFHFFLVSGQHLRNHWEGHKMRLLRGVKGNDSHRGCSKSDRCLGWKGLLPHWSAGRGGNVDVALGGGRLGIPDTRGLQRLQSRGAMLVTAERCPC